MCMETDEEYLKLLRKLTRSRNFSKKLSSELNMSLGKINYCLKALKTKGLIKIKNFKKNKEKLIFILFNSQGYCRKNQYNNKVYEIKNERV